MSDSSHRSFPGAVAQAARYDLSFFRTNPRFTAAMVVFLFIPALYAGIYLSSLWDFASRTRNLTVVLVNQDQGTVHLGARIDVGRTLIDSLTEDPRFTYRRMDDAESALRAVDEGSAAFAVLIPPDFSRRVLGADELGAARFTVHASEGNNYSGAGFARRFAPEIATRLNQRLNEQRFDAVLKMVNGSEGGLAQLRQAIARLIDGSTQVAAGTQQARAGGQSLADGTGRIAQGSGQLEQGLKGLEAGSRQLTEGIRQSAEAIRAMRARLPPEVDLARLRGGATELTDGQRELVAALVRLEDGARRLRDGATTFGEEAALVPFAGKALADSATRLRDGAGALRDGLEAAAEGGMRLELGAGTLAVGVGTLAQGTSALGNALSRLDGALPPQRTLELFSAGQASAAQGASELADATLRLQSGGKALRAGLEQLDAAAAQVRDGLLALRVSLPPPTSTPNGTPAGLSSTVRAQLEYSARVPNQATAMAPNFVPLALWVGATLCAVLFAYQKLPAPMAGQPTLGIVFGKLAVPAGVVAGQAVLLAVLLQVVMKIEVVSTARFVATLVLTALTFLAVLFMLVRVFGSAGKLIAVILLVTQLGASGSTLPIELATPFFQALHPYLPMSWSVRAIRISMFGAYAGAWLQSIATLGAMLVTAVAVAAVVGRWKVVEPEEYQPLLD